MAILAWIVIEVLRTLSWETHANPEQLVFHKQAEMQKVWEADGGKADQMPKVDFDKETVAAVFAGEKPAGTSVKVDLVVQGENDNRLLVLYHVDAPEKEVKDAPKIRPAQVLVLKKFDGEINFLDTGTKEGKEGRARIKQSLKQ